MVLEGNIVLQGTFFRPWEIKSENSNGHKLPLYPDVPFKGNVTNVTNFSIRECSAGNMWSSLSECCKHGEGTKPLENLAFYVRNLKAYSPDIPISHMWSWRYQNYHGTRYLPTFLQQWDLSDTVIQNGVIPTSSKGHWSTPKTKAKSASWRKHNCNHCNSVFGNKGQLRSHMRIHTGERPYVCTLCLKTFTRNEELTRHQRIHTGVRPFICVVCGKSFGRKDHLKKHCRIHDRKTSALKSNPTMRKRSQKI